ncbi:MAG TPA: cation-translocating P-type ATPase [Acidimicrobiales bacterium]|nr:cation-translocating P-type ATPase [Acidimicrobiales bacterium]
MTLTDVRAGLTSAEVADRVARGLRNDVPEAPTRTVAEIVKANLFTRFNFLVGSLLIVILVVGPLNDALFGGVVIANTLIGIVQELRAKRTLDRLAVVNAPHARVVRDGQVVSVPMRDVVLDDVLEIGPGDQVVVDGEVGESASLEVDESLLTGESDTVPKPPGSTIMSGSFVAAGTGRYQATKVGREAYAVALAEEARRFTLVRSELRAGIDTIITLAIYGMVPTAILLLVSQLQASDSVSDALRTSVGGVVAMVPEGLVLLTSVAFAVGVVRLGRVNVLVQELPAVEGLARVDVLCLDKTGTLTEGAIVVQSVETIGEAGAQVQAALGAFAAADPSPNATALALRESFPLPAGWQATAAVPFASARKWSAVQFADQGSWYLGAPDILLQTAHTDDADLDGRVRSRVEEQALAGRRVVLLASSAQPLNGEGPPADLTPKALVLLEDKIRADAADTLAYFAEQGVTIKVISGDHPATVGAVARRCGVTDDDPVDARALPEEPAHLGVALEASTVFGRVTPHQKREMVKALQARGHIVAMTGDGVNDVLALKDADIGIAMGAGSSAARAVAQLVLLDNSFATLPGAVAEGRRVINNLERVANLFVTKTVYSMMIALAVGITVVPFPFLPRHLTLVGALTIGIPSFFLALAPNEHRAKTGFVKRVLVFAIPAGITAAAATFTGYALTRIEEDITLEQARTTAAIVLMGVGLVILARLARPLIGWRRTLVLSMLGAFVAVLVIPPLRDFFDLSMPPAIVVFACIGLTSLAAQALTLEERVLAHYGLPVLVIEEDEEDEDRRWREPLPPPHPTTAESVRSNSAQADPSGLTGP